MKTLKAIALLAVLLQLAACGSESPEETTSNSPSAQTPAAEKPAQEEGGEDGRKWLRAATAATPAKAGTGRWSRLEQAAGPASNRLVLPHGAPPKEVVFKDLRIGKGPTIDEWDRFALKFQRFSYKSGALEEKSSVHVITYVYGVGELVKGWESGLKGMRAGGTRELIVPARLAYDKPVVYVVELLELVKEE